MIPNQEYHYRHLRLSVTEACDLRCRYCRPPGFDLPPAAQSLAPAECERLVRVLHSRSQFSKIKITGGEPLLYRPLIDLIERLSHLSPRPELSLTTNGTHLAKLAPALKGAGLCRVNVSLDSIDPSRFRQLSGGEAQATMNGIEAAIEAGLTPVKLNAVLVESTWRDDVPQLLTFAASRGLEIRFIELMRTGAGAGWAAGEYVSALTVLRWLETSLDSAYLEDSSSPARQIRMVWDGKPVTTGWITPESHPFCVGCDRLRLDSTGQLRRCLMDPRSFPLKEQLETNVLGWEEQLERYLSHKTPPISMETRTSMVKVGG